MRRDLLLKTEKLSKEAKTLPRTLGLEFFLNGFLEWQVIGSTELNLVYKPDLDIKIKVGNDPASRVDNLLSKLRRKISGKILIKNINSDLINICIPMWVNPKTKTEWNLDFGLCSSKFYQQEIKDFYRLKKKIDKLSERKRSLVLEIKEKSCGKEKYDWGAMIYSAVLSHGIKSAEEYFDLVNKRKLTPSNCNW